MQNVSAAYKNGMKSPLRNRGYIQVSFGIFNENLQSQAEFSHPADTYIYYSNDSRVFSEGTEDLVYATLENNFFKVDGTQRFLPPQDSRIGLQNSGVVSQELVDDGNVIFTINFPQTTWYGMTINFGENYPVDFDIIFGSETVQVRGNTQSEYVANRAFTNVSQIKLKFWTMRDNGNRARIYSIRFGIGYVFGNDDIMDSSLNRMVSPISEYVPQYDFTVQLKNYDHYFDADNPNSAINFLSDDSKVSVQYGLELDDGTIEWVAGQKLLVSEWESDDKTATIRCTDILRRLDMEFPGTIYYKAGVTYGELAEILLYDVVGVDTCTIPESMYDWSTSLPLPRGKVKELLQMIANACQCVLMCDREGNIEFREVSLTSTPTFKMDKMDMMSYPLAKRTDPVKEILISYQRWSKNGSEVSLISEEITVAAGTLKTYYFNDPYYAYRVTINGSAVTVADFGDYFVNVYFGSAQTATVDIYAKPYTVVEQQYSYEVSGVTEGRTVTWNNPLIDSENHAILLGFWLWQYYNSDIEYAYDTRGNPELDPCDIIYQENNYHSNMKVMLTEQSLSFRQSFRDKVVTRKIGGSS